MFVWVAFVLFIFIPLYITGLFTIPFAAMCKAYYFVIDEEKAAKGEHPWVGHFSWGWMKVWDNWEDGIMNITYKQYDSRFMQTLYWSITRSPKDPTK